MIKILFRALTISLLYTVVCSHLFSSRSQKISNNILCLNQKGVSPIQKTVRSTSKHSDSFCNEGISLSEMQYRKCVQSSEICDAPGTFQIPKVPSRYYTCTLNENKGRFEKEVRTCEGDKVFDPLTLHCLTADELQVSKSIPEKSKDRSPRCVLSQIFPDKHDCKSFYRCSGFGSAAIKLYCAPGMYFSEKRKTCTKFMTRSCAAKLRASERSNRDGARKHFEALQKILKKVTDEKDKASAHSNSEETKHDEGEPNPPPINFSRILPSLSGESDETSEDEEESWFLPNLFSRILMPIKKIISYDDHWKQTKEINEIYELLKKQHYDSEKVIKEMKESDEDTNGLEQIIALNNHLMKSIAIEIRQRLRPSSLHKGGISPGGEHENADESDLRQFWLRLARDQISLSKHLGHLREAIYGH